MGADGPIGGEGRSPTSWFFPVPRIGVLSPRETTFLLTNDDGWDAPAWPRSGRRRRAWDGAGWWPRSARSRGAGTG